MSGVSMRTTLDLDESLLQEALSLSGEKTKTAAIEKALEELIKARRRENLRSMLGHMDLRITWKGIHRLREDERW